MTGHASCAKRVGRACVDREERVETVERLVLEGHAAEREPRVVHDRVDAIERVQRRSHRASRAVLGAEVAEVRERLSAGGVDRGDDFVRRAGVGAGAEELGAGVAHDDLRASLGEQQRVATADASSRAGDQHDPIVEAQFAHDVAYSARPPY